MKPDYKIIAVDFDGTLCENKWPDIGKPNLKLINWLRKQQKMGAKVILWTCRENAKLLEAVYWCNRIGLYFNAINENVESIKRSFGSDCRKIYADVYIDDLSFNPAEEPIKLYFGNPVTATMEEYNDLGYNTKLEHIDDEVDEKIKITITSRRMGVEQSLYCIVTHSLQERDDILMEGLKCCMWKVKQAEREKIEVDYIRHDLNAVEEMAKNEEEKKNLNG